MKRWLLIAALMLAVPQSVAQDDGRLEESLVVGLTQDVIHITSNFTGAEFVVYGAIEAPDAFIGAAERDIVIVVRGPASAVTVRKRGRVSGVWLNVDQATFDAVPGFYALASTAPLDSIAAPAVLKRKAIGLSNQSWTGTKRRDIADFQRALIRSRMSQRLFVEEEGGVEMNGASLFQTRIVMPASVPVGDYRVEAYLFRNGQELSAYSATLVIDKLGLERTLYNFATRRSLFYAAAAIVIAVLMGLGAAFIFRERD